MQAPGSTHDCGFYCGQKYKPGYQGSEPSTQEHENTICSRLAPNPVDDAGLLSFATFSWLTPVMIQSYKHTLTVDTLPPLSPYDSSDINSRRYQGHQGGGIVSKGSQEFCYLFLCSLQKLTHLEAVDLLSSCSLRYGLNCLHFLAQSLGKVLLGRKNIVGSNVRLGTVGAALWTVYAIWDPTGLLREALSIISSFIYF